MIEAIAFGVISCLVVLLCILRMVSGLSQHEDRIVITNQRTMMILNDLEKLLKYHGLR